MATFSQRLSVVLVVSLLSVIAGCGSSNGHKLMSIVVTPATSSIAVGATQQFKATATYHNGMQADITSTVTWNSATIGVATISSAGLATGVTAGTSAITATMGTVVSAPVTLTVTAAATLTSIAVTPATPSIAVGATQQFTATGTYSDSTQKDITSTVTWKSGTTGVATITATGGLATAVAVGTSAVTATLGAVVSPAVILTVTPAGVTLVSISVLPASPTVAVGQTVDFTATGHFSDSSTQPLPNATWSSGTPATASILSPGGIAIALATGTTSITASTGGITSPGDTLTVQAAVARAAYVAGVTDGNGATYALASSTANLIPIGSVPFSNSPTQIVPEPSGRFAFILQGSGGGITTASIDNTTGRLSGLPSTLGTSVDSNFGVVDPTGRFLYVAASGGATDLNSYAISAVDGSLTPIGAGINVGSSLAAVIVDRTGKFLYATDQGGNTLFAYSIDQSTGALTAPSTASYATGNVPQYPAIDPSNSHLFVPNSTDNSISVFTIANDGSLTPIGTVVTGNGLNGPSIAVVDVTGKYLYVTNVNGNTVSGFSIAGSVLTALASSPVPTGSIPFGIAIDPANTTVAVVNDGSNTLSIYSLDAPTGKLTPAALPQVESSAGPLFVAFGTGVASPKVNPGAVYAVNPGSGDISAFTSTAATGALTAAAGSPFPGITGNSFAAADLQGKLLFTGSAAGNQIAGSSVNQSSAALTSLTGSPLSVTGTDLASAIYVAPTSTNAYVLDVTSGSVVQDTIDPAAGTVTGPGTSVAAFAGAKNLAADPQGDFVYALGLSATNGIQAFTTYLSGGGALTATAPPTPYSGNWTSGAVDGSGQFLVAVDSTLKSLQSFSIALANAGNDGSVTALPSPVSLTGAGPWVVAFDPQDRVVYVADQTAGTITPYAFNSSTGALGAAGTVANVSANGLTNISTDITGSFLYAGAKAAAAPGSKGAVAVYSIGATGGLTAVGSPATTGTGNPGVAATNVVQ